MIKDTLIKIVDALGYDVHIQSKRKHISDLPLYQKLYDGDSLENRRFYNVGAGSFSHPYWTNIDFYSEWYQQNTSNIQQGIIYDLLSLSAMPLDDHTAEIFYTSHTIEHITDAAAQNLFDEAYRILKKDGIFRISTPNIDLAYRAYLANDRAYFYWTDWFSSQKGMEKMHISKPMNESSIEQLFLHHFASNTSTLHKDGIKNPIDDKELKAIFNNNPYETALNFCMDKCDLDIQKKYSGNHINWWNKNKLERMLEKAGFSDIQLSGFGQSQAAVMRNVGLFDNTHNKISIYIEAKK